MRRRTLLGAALAAGGLAAAGAEAADAASPPLTALLESDLDITGVATRHGRTFACAQARDGAPGPQVVEFVEGRPRPYPDAAWNAWKPGDDGAKVFVGVSALRVGQDHGLWVVDRGAPRIGDEPVFGAAKAMRIDLETNRVSRIYDLSPALNGASLLAQIRFDGRFAHIADAGWPGVVVLRIETGETWRALTDETAVKPARPLRADGRALRGDRGLLELGAALLEISPNGDVLFLQPPCGPMWKIPTRLVEDSRLPAGALAQALEPFADTPSSWGSAMDGDGNLYLADIDRRRILKITPRGRIQVLAQDPRLAFVGALWIDDEGNLLCPAARLDETGAFGRKDVATGPFTVWRLAIGAAPLRR